VSFPEKLMADDEEVVEHLHPHWITLVGPVVAFLLICGLSGLGIAFLPDSSKHHGPHQILLYAILIIALLLIIWLVLVPVIKWRSTHYVITTHRVLIRRGVLNHVGRDITLGRINDVSYEQSIWDRIVGAGSLTIESAGEQGQETLVNIPHADNAQQTLNRLIEADSVRRSQPYGGGPQQGQPQGQQYPQQGQQQYPQQGQQGGYSNDPGQPGQGQYPQQRRQYPSQGQQ
jgi:membrane protein YdbS with pleckstrin-like domain